MQSYTLFLKNTFLFKNVSESDIVCLTKPLEIEIKSFPKGSVIYSPDDFERKLGFVVDGECLVCRHTGKGSIVPLNTIQHHGAFGVIGIFSKRDEFPTTVKSKNKSTVLFFSKKDILCLIAKNPQISINVIEFLNDKIEFLNDKLASFSGGCVEEKLAGYILELQNKHHKTVFEFNKKKSAEALNCGRASLYRAIESLELQGYISFENKLLSIIDQKGLERILK